MRTLIVAEEAVRRDALAAEVRRSGHEVCGASDVARITAEVRRAVPGPEVCVIDAGGHGVALRRTIDRMRHAAERPLPVVLMLPQSSAWLHGALPSDLLPAVPVPARGLGAGGLARALAALGGGVAAAAPVTEAPPLALDGQRREVRGPAGTTRLTPSEVAVLSALMQGGGGVVPAERMAQALWGNALIDRHSRATIRSHVYTLRAKLRSIGLDGAVASLAGVGYRLVLDEAAD